MMRKLFIILLLFCSTLKADIAVITNIDNHLVLTKQEIEEIFMGRTHTLSNGDFVLPLDHNDLRSEFYLKLTNRPIEQINSYWARILFSGQASPPPKLPDDAAVINTVIKNKSAIGYIDNKNANTKLIHVLFILN